MKKQLLILTFLLTFLLPMNTVQALDVTNMFPSGKNTINGFLGFPYGLGIEYERQASLKIPMLAKFKWYLYGSNGTMSYDNDSIKISSIGAGIRLNLIFGFFAGIGVNSSKLSVDSRLIKSSQGHSIGTKVAVTLTPMLLYAEFGYRLNLGPVSAGLSVGVIPGQPSLKTKIANETIENIARDSIDQSLAEIKAIPIIRFFAGFTF